MAFEYTKRYTVSSPPANIIDLQTDNLYITGSIGIGTENSSEKFVVGTGTSTFVVTGIGSVGIGSTRPTKTLDVRGDTIISGNTTITGNVGIGTSIPSHKLDVDGAIQITPGASVTPTNIGDVVFEFPSNTKIRIKARGSDGLVRYVEFNLTLL